MMRARFLALAAIAAFAFPLTARAADLPPANAAPANGAAAKGAAAANGTAGCNNCNGRHFFHGFGAGGNCAGGKWGSGVGGGMGGGMGGKWAGLFGHDGKLANHPPAESNKLGKGFFQPPFQAAPWYLYWPYDAHFQLPAPIGAPYYPPQGLGSPWNPYFPAPAVPAGAFGFGGAIAMPGYGPVPPPPSPSYGPTPPVGPTIPPPAK
jgi:hypothetical protein